MTETIRILALETAVPNQKISQEEIKDFAPRLFGDNPRLLENMLPVYDNAGIEFRRLSQPLDWYARESSWKENQTLFAEHAIRLLEEAVHKALQASGIEPNQIDAVVTVCTTGISTPSLDVSLKNRVGFRDDIIRVPIFGWGCAGGVLGLMRAVDIAKAHPCTRVLLLVVELCSLTFRPGDKSKSNIIASALFGDGAAALIIGPSTKGEKFIAGKEHTWPNTEDIMGWRVENDGLGVLFSKSIPSLVERELGFLLKEFLMSKNLKLSEINAFSPHPGGEKVLNALETVFEIESGTLYEAREILRDYGNMSSATVLFVLKRILSKKIEGKCLMSSLGPGFSAAFALIETTN